MSEYCPIVKTKVTYMFCQDCEEKFCTKCNKTKIKDSSFNKNLSNQDYNKENPLSQKL